MSENKAESKKPKVTRVFPVVPVHLGASVKSSIGVGEYTLERTQGGVLVRYWVTSSTGKGTRCTSFIPDANIAIMDLEEAP